MTLGSRGEGENRARQERIREKIEQGMARWYKKKERQKEGKKKREGRGRNKRDTREEGRWEGVGVEKKDELDRKENRRNGEQKGTRGRIEIWAKKYRISNSHNEEEEVGTRGQKGKSTLKIEYERGRRNRSRAKEETTGREAGKQFKQETGQEKGGK